VKHADTQKPPPIAGLVKPSTPVAALSAMSTQQFVDGERPARGRVGELEERLGLPGTPEADHVHT
jgi:hypothetical protein